MKQDMAGVSWAAIVVFVVIVGGYCGGKDMALRDNAQQAHNVTHAGAAGSTAEIQ